MSALFESRTDASAEFNHLVEALAAARGRIDDLDAEQRRAGQDALAAAEAVADLEVRQAHGETVADTERKRLEQALARAKARRDEPWPERLQGARRAVMEREQAMRACARRRY